MTFSETPRLLGMSFRNAITVLGFLLVTTALVAQASLSSDDVAKIREVHRRYEQAWLKNDPDGVRALFTEDSVLLPHHGDPPRIGRKELDAFWFPPNSPAATINKLELRITDLGGEGNIAYVWGTDEVSWTTVQEGKTTTAHNLGTFLNILKKQTDGSWKISHHMWDDPVPQTQ